MQMRKFNRYATDIPVSFVIDDMMGEHRLYLNDVSQGGVSLKAHGCIDCHTHVKIKFPISDESCSADGKITWCQLLDNGQCLLGVTFEKLIGQSAVEKMVQLH